jgi:hypothetical protein
MENSVKELKRFERDGGGNMTFAPFTANGKTYRFIKPGDSIGVEKWTEYQRLQIVVGAGASFSSLITAFSEHKRLLGSDQPFSDIRTEAILWADSQMKGLVELSRARYESAFYLCSLFIYREGEDPFFWSKDLAESMIEDWGAERIDEKDLFFFAMQLLPAWQPILKELSGQEARNAGRSLVDILLREAK